MTFEQEQLEEPDSAQRPSRHATIMRGIVAPILGLLALTAVIFGALNATIWKPDSHVDAAVTVSRARYIVTDPGVLRLIDDRSRLTVSAPKGQRVCIALGSAKDVAGWIAGYPYTRLTGLSTWTTLATEAMGAQGTKAADDGSAVPIQDSDMWSGARCGSSSVSIRADAGNATDVALIDTGGNAGKVTVAMAATRQKLPDFATPLYFIGALLVLLTVLAASVFAMPSHKRRKRYVVSEPAAVSEEVAIAEAFTGSIRGLKSAMKIRPQGGSRHKRHAQSAPGGASAMTPEEHGASRPSSVGPVVVDPGERNLVADMQGVDPSTHGDAAAVVPQQNDAAIDEPKADADEATTVISHDELQAYFARLSQEIAGGSETAAQEGTSAGQAPADGASTQDASAEHTDDGAERGATSEGNRQ